MGRCKLDCPSGETECCICCDKQDSCQCRCDMMDSYEYADEVVQQLEKLIEDKTSESGDDWWTAQCLNEAVDIVKGGGVDDN